MTDTILIQVEAERAERWFGELLRRSADLTGLMADIGQTLLESTQARFTTGIAPDGTVWAPLRDGSGRTPLLDTGTMRDQIYPSHGSTWVELSATAKQARWHQEGTDGPYVIEPKNGKALAFGARATHLSGPGRGKEGPVNAREGAAHVVKKVTHPGLPARPFMGLSAADEEAIDTLAQSWLDLTPAGG